MYEDEFVRVKKQIKDIDDEGILSNHLIISFGVSENTRQIIQMVKEVGKNVAFIIDNDKTRTGGYFARVPVKGVNQLNRDEIKTAIFFIYSYFWREMRSQLVEMGVKEERIYSFFLSDKSLDEQFIMAEKGRDICEELFFKYEKLPIFLCPYTGTGDIYLIGTFWESYLKKTGVRDYIFVVVSKACARVTKIFDIHNVEIITQIESSYLVEYYKLSGDSSGIKILNDSWWELRANPLQRFRGYKGLYFTEIFRKFVFELPNDMKPIQPVLRDAYEEIVPIFEQYTLIFENTVVLSPFSNTLSDLPDDFWIRLTEEFKKKGYCVCTNCGSENEMPVEGTEGVFVPLDIMPQFVDMAGIFIGVRSGLCDCISASRAKKVILYDKRNRFFNSSAYEYFSLNYMGLCDDAIELLYDSDIEGLVAEIIKYF